jgi:hypothetical protein
MSVMVRPSRPGGPPQGQSNTLRATQLHRVHPELDASKEDFGLLVRELIGMDDVASEPPHKIGNSCHEPALVGRENEESRGGRRLRHLGTLGPGASGARPGPAPSLPGGHHAQIGEIHHGPALTRPARRLDKPDRVRQIVKSPHLVDRLVQRRGVDPENRAVALRGSIAMGHSRMIPAVAKRPVWCRQPRGVRPAKGCQ